MKSEQHTPSYFLFKDQLENAEEWQMYENERAIISFLLQSIKPETSIEIGTRRAGSLSVISKYSGKAYSIDIDPECKKKYSNKFPNTQFIVGDSKETLPALIDKIISDGEHLGFVLIDGDHTKAGVLTDINNIWLYSEKVGGKREITDRITRLARYLLKLCKP